MSLHDGLLHRQVVVLSPFGSLLAPTESYGLAMIVSGSRDYAIILELLDFRITQRYCCVMIPALVDIGAPWKVLPSGLHEASLDEVEARFGTDPHRKRLCDGFRRGCEALRSAGCRVVYLDGSYATEKPVPRDFDVCWDPDGVDLAKLDPVLLDFSDMRATQKRKYGGEFFPAIASADSSRIFLEYFQVEKTTGLRKGLILVRL